jgi:hypothetical protein
MSSYYRLKQQINSEWKPNQFAQDVRTLIEENERYRHAYTSLKSCQHIAGVEKPDLLAGKIKQLINESDSLEQILNAKDRTEALEILEKIKKSRES